VSIVQNDYDFHISDIGHIHEREPDPQWKFDRLVNHEYYVIAYCKAGEAAYRIGGNEVLVTKGDLLFFPNGLIRSAISNPNHPWAFYSVSFDIRFDNGNVPELFDGFGHLARTPHLHKLPSLFDELNLVWTGKQNGYKVKCKSVIMDILYALIKEGDRKGHGTAHYNAIERTNHMILSHYRDHFSIEDLAKLSGLSPSHFRLLYKKITGMTAVQFQNNVRINKAKDLLLSGECNVTEAALSVGYQDIYYFSRLFKKLTGEPPSEYLKG
jgi:AraC-like DNA-binding protein